MGDAGEAAFAAADAAARASAGISYGGKASGGSRSGASRQSSRKSVAGAVGGGWEASGAHAASTLVDVFPPEEGDDSDSREQSGATLMSTLTRGRAVGVSSGGFGGGGTTRGVSPLVRNFLEGPALERFGGGALFRKSSVGTFGGRRSTLTFAASDRRSSTSVRFLDDGRRSTVGGWGENDEAARPGASVCKDCLSDVASLLALAMAPIHAAKTVMEVGPSVIESWETHSSMRISYPLYSMTLPYCITEVELERFGPFASREVKQWITAYLSLQLERAGLLFAITCHLP